MSKEIKYVCSEELLKQANKNPAIQNRASLTHELLRSFSLLDHMQILPAKICNAADLRGFHSRDYIEQLRNCGASVETEACEDELNENLSAEEYGLGYDCPVWPGIIDYACTIAGATMTACDALCKYATTEPPIIINWTGGWHHAQRDKASGFCYVNDIVLGILVLRKRYQRVLYIDLDVHHGNGVEEAFETTKRVFTLSFHKYECGYYPGSGALHDNGRFAKGYAANFPYRNGITGLNFRKYFKRVLLFIKTKYQPDICVVQCGADVIAGDPLGGTQILPSDMVDCIDYVLSFKLPTLLLGGGGYNLPNASKYWTQLTASVCGVHLGDDIPDDNAYFLHYGPDYSIKVTGPRHIRDENTMEYLEKCATTIEENLTKYNLKAVC